MSVTLAGWRVRLDVNSEELVAAFAPRYAPFCDRDSKCRFRRAFSLRLVRQQAFAGRQVDRDDRSKLESVGFGTGCSVQRIEIHIQRGPIWLPDGLQYANPRLTCQPATPLGSQTTAARQPSQGGPL